MDIRKFIEEYFNMSRYIALGTLDGILAVMAVTLAASSVGAASGHPLSNYAVCLTGLSAGIALALSNAFGSFIGERAEEARTLRELEEKMMLNEGDLDETIIHKQAKRRVYLSMFTHGFSSFIGSFVPIIPFLLIPGRLAATLTTLTLCFTALFILGVYLGKVSRKNLVKAGIEVLLIGIVIGTISILIGEG
jgi:predicted membrane protein (TIGR00267 family)